MIEEERDGPFDLTPSEIVAIMNTIGVHVSREQAAAFGAWCYSTFRQWKIDSTPMPEFEQLASRALPKAQEPDNQPTQGERV